MSKSQVKKLLATMSKEEVINVVMELYDARKEAKDYLDYFADPNEEGELEKFKKIVFKEFGDDEEIDEMMHHWTKQLSRPK